MAALRLEFWVAVFGLLLVRKAASQCECPQGQVPFKFELTCTADNECTPALSSIGGSFLFGFGSRCDVSTEGEVINVTNVNVDKPCQVDIFVCVVEACANRPGRRARCPSGMVAIGCRCEPEDGCPNGVQVQGQRKCVREGPRSETTGTIKAICVNGTRDDFPIVESTTETITVMCTADEPFMTGCLLSGMNVGAFQEVINDSVSPNTCTVTCPTANACLLAPLCSDTP